MRGLSPRNNAGTVPGLLANRVPKSVPGTRCGARPDASKQEPKSVPGTRCDARSDASKQGAQIGARHEWHGTPGVRAQVL